MAPHIDSRTEPAAAPTPGGQRMNALKHGYYHAGILMPGEDPETYRRHREALFLLYRPQTVREAQLVSGMAEWQWQLERSGPLQARCDDQALHPVVDAADRVAEPLAHRRLHTTIDVNLHRTRLDRAVRRNERDLLTLQKLRRLGLIEGALPLPPGCYLETSGQIVAPAAAQAAAPATACQVAAEPGPTVPEPAVTPSPHTANQNPREQKETGAAWAPAPPPDEVAHDPRHTGDPSALGRPPAPITFVPRPVRAFAPPTRVYATAPLMVSSL